LSHSRASHPARFYCNAADESWHANSQKYPPREQKCENARAQVACSISMNSMTKILVVYYSRTGHTKEVAHHIASACGADIESIVETSKSIRRKGFSGYAKCALEAALQLKVPLRKPMRDAKKYDLVVIGTPIWFWSMCSPVRSYITKYRSDFKRVAFFCTCGGGGQEKVLKDLAHLCGRVAVAECAIREHEIVTKQYDHIAAPFIGRLRKYGTPAAHTRSGKATD
jgi:flavodoxin